MSLVKVIFLSVLCFFDVLRDCVNNLLNTNHGTGITGEDVGVVEHWFRVLLEVTVDSGTTDCVCG